MRLLRKACNLLTAAVFTATLDLFSRHLTAPHSGMVVLLRLHFVCAWHRLGGHGHVGRWKGGVAADVDGDGWAGRQVCGCGGRWEGEVIGWVGGWWVWGPR